MPQHDPETVRLGRENIARIRAQLGVAAKSKIGAEPPPTIAETHPVDIDEPPPSIDETEPLGGELTADRIQVEMATAEERDRMRTTIVRLEARVAQLETTLAAVVRTAATGIESAADSSLDNAAQ